MTDLRQQTAFAYADASYRKLSQGAGFVVRLGDRIHLACRPLKGMSGANHSEASAAQFLVEHLLALPARPTRVHLLTDSLNLVMKFGSPEPLQPRRPSVEEARTVRVIGSLKAMCEEAGVDIHVGHCKGHASTGSAKGFLNHCADRLSALAATGADMSWDVPFDAFWRLNIMGCHDDLVCDGYGLTPDEAADFLEVDSDVVRRLVAHRHLRSLHDRSLIGAESLIRVRRQIRDNGPDMPARLVPLRQMLGRIEEVDSGFGDGAIPSCPVRVLVSLIDHMDFIPAAICLEGSEGTEVHSRRFEVTGEQSWETVLEGVIDLVRHRYPGCDRLTVIATDPLLVDALNGAGMRGDHPVLDALDVRIGSGELTTEAYGVPRHWKGWRVRFMDALLDGLVGSGTEVSCMVGEDPNGIITTTAMPPGCEPPWAEPAELVGARP